jgi:putative phosphonate catabolism associated alcohol dehydrogenase
MKNNCATAIVFNQSGVPMKEEFLLLPTPADQEILVQITYTTICTSDVHTYTGKRSTPCPCVLGHEIIGTIVNIGENIKTDYNHSDLNIGDRITWSVYAYNDQSEMAKKGIPQKSDGLHKYGHSKFTPEDGLNGGFATHCLLKKGTAVYKLPEILSNRIAAPINCTHATIAGALRLAGNLHNKNILITGTGMLGLSACAMAKENGASNVYTLDINSERLTVSKKFGATAFFDGNCSVDQINNQLSNSQKIDIVIDTTGIPQVMEKGLELLSIGGTAVWVGAVFTQQKTQINAELIVRNLLTIRGLHNYTPEDLSVALEFIKSSHHKYPFDFLVGQEFALTELSTAFEVAISGKHYRVGIPQ